MFELTTEGYCSYPIDVQGVLKLVPRFTADQLAHLMAQVAKNFSAEHKTEWRHSLKAKRGWRWGFAGLG